MSFNRKIIVYLLASSLFAALIATGCGVKTAPVPPTSLPPAAISDLRYTADQGTATLQWSIPTGKAAGTSGLAGFIVFRALTPADQPICDGCPVMFRQVANIPAAPYLLRDAESKEATFRQELDPGFHYMFKVIAYARDGQRGPDSNRIEIKND